MTKGLAFLVGMVVEGIVAALLAVLLRRRFGLSRFSAAVRCAAAAVIGTGATNPVLWNWYTGLEGWTGTWWGAVALSEAGVVLVETLFYAAALRGHWRWSLALSMVVNAVAFCANILVTTEMARPN